MLFRSNLFPKIYQKIKKLKKINKKKMPSFKENSERLEFVLREIEYSMGTLNESVNLLHNFI